MFLKTLMLASILFALRDWYIIEIKKRSPNHGKGFTMRLVISSLICLVIAKDNNDLIENFIAAPGIVWFTFQYGLNVLRGKPLTHMSDSNKTDQILLKIFKKPKTVFVVLLLLFLSSIIFKMYGL